MSKITKATFKSFIRKNRENLLIRVKSKFDGMTDMCQSTNSTGFDKALDADHKHDNNCGIQGVWITHNGNYFTEYEKDGIKGIEVYNCCGQFIIGVKNA